ncbi:MAG: CYTH domain-containing protein [Bacillota bacterium]|nr:CYTH domain-containing protein [Bacillota bacterium]
MEKYHKEINYIVLAGTKETWADLQAGKNLYLYFKKDLGNKLKAFFYDPKDQVLYGQINFEEKLAKSSQEMEEFSKEYDYGNFSKEDQDQDQIFAWAIGSLIKIQPIYIEDQVDFDQYLSLDQEGAENYLSLIESNYLGQEDFEQEVKFLLDQTEFERIYGDFVGEKNPQRQVNYYFDPSAYVKNKSTTVRIREKNGAYTLTVKEKKSQEKDLSTEKSAPISCQDFEKIMAAGSVNIKAYIRDSQLGDLSYLGALETIRDEVTYKNIYLAFDISSYFGKTDYEIEMEGRQNHIKELRKKLGLENKAFNDISKFARFMAEYEKSK